jgi:hypothetical protein
MQSSCMLKCVVHIVTIVFQPSLAGSDLYRGHWVHKATAVSGRYRQTSPFRLQTHPEGGGGVADLGHNAAPVRNAQCQERRFSRVLETDK